MCGLFVHNWVQTGVLIVVHVMIQLFRELSLIGNPRTYPSFRIIIIYMGSSEP